MITASSQVTAHTIYLHIEAAQLLTFVEVNVLGLWGQAQTGYSAASVRNSMVGRFFFPVQRPELLYKDIILLQAPMNHPELLPSFDIPNSLSISVLDCKTSSLSSCNKHIIIIILLVYTNLWENQSVLPKKRPGDLRSCNYSGAEEQHCAANRARRG